MISRIIFGLQGFPASCESCPILPRSGSYLSLQNTLLALFFFPLICFAQNLIFVHLGEEIPSCLFTTMRQARFFNEKSDLYLLVDKKAHPIFEEKHREFLEREQVFLIDLGSIPLSEEHRTFWEVNPIDPSISKGFWVFASERFFALFDFIQEKRLKQIIHLESDSMLYLDLDEIMPHFEQLRIAAPFQSLVGCIPCFVYIRDAESLSLLVNHMLAELSGGKSRAPHLFVNDMQTLASFFRTYGAEFLTPLPTLMPEYARFYPKRWSRFMPDNRTSLRFLSSQASQFPGWLFDAAGLAIYMNGNDRRDSPGHGAGTIHSRSLFHPGHFSYSWGEDSQGRAVPYLSFRGKNYRIVNLHFHSKMPEEYTSFNSVRKKLP